jgi:phosphatidylserine synthase
MNQEQAIRVSQAVWPWQAPAAAKARGLPRPWRAALQAALVAVIATLFLLLGHKTGVAICLYGVSAVLLLSGLFVPAVFKRFEQFAAWAGLGAGLALTWLLLTLFFFLCVFPGRLLLLALGKDPMRRRWERQKESYWTELKPAPPGGYTRQY